MPQGGRRWSGARAKRDMPLVVLIGRSRRAIAGRVCPVLNRDCIGKLYGLGLREMRSTLHVWERERKGIWKVRRPFGARASI
jgi:hypothetical protein